MIDLLYDVFFGDQLRKYVAVAAGFIVSQLLVIVVFGAAISSKSVPVQVAAALITFGLFSWFMTHVYVWRLRKRADIESQPASHAINDTVDLRVPIGRRETSNSLLASLEIDTRILDNEIANIEIQFRRDLENWLMWPVAEHILPHRLQHDIDDARLLFQGVVPALVAEAAFVGWLFKLQHVNPWYGVCAGVLLTQVLYATLAAVFTDHDWPQLALTRLRRFIVIPSAVLFLVTFAASVLIMFSAGAAVNSPGMLISLTQLISIMSLTTLAGALQMNALALRWSARFERQWLRLQRLSQRNKELLRSLYEQPSPATVPGAPVTTNVEE